MMLLQNRMSGSLSSSAAALCGCHRVCNINLKIFFMMSRLGQMQHQRSVKQACCWPCFAALPLGCRALGAFLGGIVVADTEYGHRAMGDILPLRDAFVSVFFVSLGMLFDLQVVLAHPLLVAGLLVGFLLGKGFLATIAAGAMRFPDRSRRRVVFPAPFAIKS